MSRRSYYKGFFYRWRSPFFSVKKKQNKCLQLFSVGFILSHRTRASVLKAHTERRNRTELNWHGLYPVYTIKLARRAGYMLAGEPARCLLCFIPRLHDRANIEQTSSKRPANIEQIWSMHKAQQTSSRHRSKVEQTSSKHRSGSSS